MSWRRYAAPTKDAPLPKTTARILVERKEHCIGCGLCAHACVYGVHARQASPLDVTKMAVPLHDRCVSCHRCTNECPVDALELRPHPDFLKAGDAYYTPDLVETLLYEAETGRVPVSGAGYRGPFTGPGFDSIWTDMSEIVRPTRDGIHGRETISTEADLGRKPSRLEFSLDGELRTPMPPRLSLALPLIFSAPALAADAALRGGRLAAALAAAAAAAGVVALLDEDDDVTLPDRPRRAVRLRAAAPPQASRCRGLVFAELPDATEVLEAARALKSLAPDPVVSIRLRAGAEAPRRAARLAQLGAEVIHIAADAHARTFDAAPEPLHECLRRVGEALTEARVRDEVSVLASGGIARAEHLPKALACGADAVAVDLALAVALGLRRFDAARGVWSAHELELGDSAAAAQRLVNLASSWRDQLLEVLGAMGMRDARRLEGEEGRAMFYDALEAEFLALFAAPALREHDPEYG